MKTSIFRRTDDRIDPQQGVSDTKINETSSPIDSIKLGRKLFSVAQDDVNIRGRKGMTRKKRKRDENQEKKQPSKEANQKPNKVEKEEEVEGLLDFDRLMLIVLNDEKVQVKEKKSEIAQPVEVKSKLTHKTNTTKTKSMFNSDKIKCIIYFNYTSV